MGPTGTSAPDMAFLGWVSSALRTGGPGMAAVPSVWVLVARWGECVLSHPVLQALQHPPSLTSPSRPRGLSGPEGLCFRCFSSAPPRLCGPILLGFQTSNQAHGMRLQKGGSPAEAQRRREENAEDGKQDLSFVDVPGGRIKGSAAVCRNAAEGSRWGRQGRQLRIWPFWGG